MHDVSPLTQDVFAAMLDGPAALGLTKCSLLVIPDHHHRRHFLTDVPFCRWLEDLARDGHELVVHGYYHQRDARPADTWMQRVVTNVYTLGEGEFYDLPKDEAAGLLALALEEFSDLDAPTPRGFIAPAWLLGDEAAVAVREAGFQYTTWLRGVEDLVRGRVSRLAIAGLQLPQRLAAQRQPRVGTRFLSRRLRRNPLIRLGLHPPDFEHEGIWRQIRRIVARHAAGARGDDVRGISRDVALKRRGSRRFKGRTPLARSPDFSFPRVPSITEQWKRLAREKGDNANGRATFPNDRQGKRVGGSAGWSRKPAA